MRAAVGEVEALPQTLDLGQAVAYALQHNFAIRQARERLRQQEGVVTTVTAAALPNVSATGSFQKSDVPAYQAPSTQNLGTPLIVPSGRYWRMALTARQTLYAGGGIRGAMTAANLNREAAILELKTVVSEALLDVEIRFYAALLAREKIKVQEQNLELLQSQLKDVTNRFETGVVSKFERLRAEVAVANARPPLITARNDFRLAVEELRQALGYTVGWREPAEQALDLAGIFAFEEQRPELTAALESAHARRPELQRMAKLVAAAEAGVQTARAGYYPNLAVTAGGELRKGPSEQFADSLKGLRAGAQAQWTRNERATIGRVQQSESQVEQARLAAAAAELAVQVEVRKALSLLEQAGELAAATQKSVAQAEEAVRIASVRFGAGMSLQLDVLRAQVELTVARTNQLQAHFERSVASARLRKATGLTEIDYMEATDTDVTLEFVP
jgi:outer membrane protein TolC